MADWVNITLPIATLIMGSVLTMTGQALHDRRMDKREQRARREDFLGSNFEVHRTAILDMQEIVQDCYKAYLAEKRRREEEGIYDYFDNHFFQLSSEAVHVSVARIDELSQVIERAPSEAERQKIRLEMAEAANSCMKQSEQFAETSKKLSAVVKGMFPFWEQYAAFIYRLRLCMYRSGSNAVISSGEAFIQGTYQWIERWGSDGLAELVEVVQESHYELNRVLSNALKFGPYDTYGDQHG